jgi:hypothetical protein
MSERIGLIAGREAWVRECGGQWIIAASDAVSSRPWWHEGTWSDTCTQWFPSRQAAIDHAEKYRTKLAKGQVWELSTGEQGPVVHYDEHNDRYHCCEWSIDPHGVATETVRLTRLISEPAPAQEPAPTPVVDLMTAPHGWHGLCRDGSIYTHGCWLDGLEGEHKALGERRGCEDRYFRHGNYLADGTSPYDIIAPYIEPPRPRTKTVWWEWWESADGKVSGVGRWESADGLRGAMARTEGSGNRTVATGKTELVEGEGL